jgi:molybdenum cofactor synthesis domain-containing protein
VEIATGAPLPAGADAGVMVERTVREGDRVQILQEVREGQNVGRRANDLAAGAVVVARGDWLSPARVGALAAAGIDRVPVFARPVVALASTGDELVPPGQPLGDGQIHDVNRFTLPAVIAAHGCSVSHLPPIADTLDEVRHALDAAAGADLIVFTGGSSVGDRDLVAEVVRERGEVFFHGVAMKPGKPTLLARLRARGEATQLFLGLSGNPTSCLANAYILLVPMLRALARLPAWRPQRLAVRLAHDIVAHADRHQFYPVRLEGETAVPAFKGSGEITSLSRADGYLEIPAGTERVPAGTTVTVTLFH